MEQEASFITSIATCRYPLSTSTVCVGATSKELNTCMLLRTNFHTIQVLLTNPPISLLSLTHSC